MRQIDRHFINKWDVINTRKNKKSHNKFKLYLFYVSQKYNGHQSRIGL